MSRTRNLTTMKSQPILAFVILAACIPSYPIAAAETVSPPKPRVIATTDGEVDDHSSMIRFLLYTCDFDVAGIVEVNSKYQKNGHSKEPWLENQLAAYDQV